jgi:hypothetical protein
LEPDTISMSGFKTSLCSWCTSSLPCSVSGVPDSASITSPSCCKIYGPLRSTSCQCPPLGIPNLIKLPEQGEMYDLTDRKLDVSGQIDFCRRPSIRLVLVEAIFQSSGGYLEAKCLSVDTVMFLVFLHHVCSVGTNLNSFQMEIVCSYWTSSGSN